MRVRLDPESEVARLVDGGLQFFRSELQGLGIAAVGQHRAACKNLDVIDTIVRKLANNFAHLPRTVSFAVVQIPGELNIRSKSSQGACATGNGDVCARNEQARANNVASVDGVAECDVAERPVGADVAHRRKTRLQHRASIRHRLKRNLRTCLLELRKWIAGSGAVREMRMAVDETGEHAHMPKIATLRAGRNCQAPPPAFNLRVVDAT